MGLIAADPGPSSGVTRLLLAIGLPILVLSLTDGPGLTPPGFGPGDEGPRVLCPECEKQKRKKWAGPVGQGWYKCGVGHEFHPDAPPPQYPPDA